ncbi:bestrophin-like domain [Actinomycetospora sp. C-140]
MPIWLLFLLLVVVVTGVAVGVQLLVRRRWPHLAGGDHNDVTGYVIAIVGVIYAVLLAFVVIVSWQQFSQAADLVGQEASALRGLYRETVPFPPDARGRIEADVELYARAVIAQEWPAMARGEPGDPAAAAALDRIADHLAALPADTPVSQEYVGVEADRFAELVSFRSQRLDYVGQGLPGVLWVALVFGGVVTIGFAMVFGLRSTTLHLLMTGSLAAVIGVLLFVCVAIDQPFVGDVAVSPAPLVRFLSDFGAR